VSYKSRTAPACPRYNDTSIHYKLIINFIKICIVSNRLTVLYVFTLEQSHIKKFSDKIHCTLIFAIPQIKTRITITPTTQKRTQNIDIDIIHTDFVWAETKKKLFKQATSQRFSFLVEKCVEFERNAPRTSTK